MEGYPETPSCLLSGTPGPRKVGQAWALIDPEPPFASVFSLGEEGGRSLRPRIKAKNPSQDFNSPLEINPKATLLYLLAGLNKYRVV